jgi:aldehyde dehydrogenase (NAD+)
MTEKVRVFADVNKQFIHGVWREGSSPNYYNIEDPYDNSLIEKVKLANTSDIDEAYRAAKAAQKHWAQVAKEEKTALIEKVSMIVDQNKDELVDLLVRETGSSVLKANIEIQLTLGLMNEVKTYPSRMEPRIEPSVIPGKENMVFREPAGVVSVISPFNFPFYLSMRAIAPAIATGNAVVHKPDIQTALSGGAVIGKIFEMAGLPPGVLNVILTDIAEIGDYFVEHPIPRIISFTGSTAVGRHIGSLAAKNLKRVALELGGNSPFIVMEDADVDQAVNAAVFGKFLHQGQICMIINRFLVHRKIYGEFVQKFAERAAQVPYGDPKDPKTIIGPIINEKQIAKVLNLIESAKKEGARMILEGKRIGNVITPFVFADVRNDMTAAQSEIFGPVALMIPFDSEAEAIEMANQTEYGLSSAIFTSDMDKGIRYARMIESGACHINDQTVNDEPAMPFGGEKCSGIGRYGGQWGLDEFTTTKWITVQKENRSYPF